MSMTNQVTHIHQVLLINGFTHPEAIPGSIQTNIDYLRALYPHANYKLWNGEEIRDFIKYNFDNQVVKSFDSLIPFSYKTDLARYCLLYLYGGIYADLAICVMNEWKIPIGKGFASFQEVYRGVDLWACTQTSLLWSKPKRRELEVAICQIVKNCKAQYYGPHDHYPTAGPLLGHALSVAMSERSFEETDDQWIGKIRYATPEFDMQNVCYIAPDNTFVARRVKRNAGDLKELGLNKTNNYVQIWKSRRVYGEWIRRWNHNDSKIVVQNGARKTDEGISISYGISGRVSYGPFVNLPAGSYKFSTNIKTNAVVVNMTIDFSENYGSHIFKIFKFDSYPIKSNDGKIDLFFDIDRPFHDVEFRLYVDKPFEGIVGEFNLSKTDIRHWNHDNLAIGIMNAERNLSGIVVSENMNARITYGPYAHIEPGRYRLRVDFSPDAKFKHLKVEVVSDLGNTFIKTSEFISDYNYLNDFSYVEL